MMNEKKKKRKKKKKDDDNDDDEDEDMDGYAILANLMSLIGNLFDPNHPAIPCIL